MADMIVGRVIPAVNSGNYPLTENVLDKQKIVMCKDCCMGEPYPREAGKTWCHLMSEQHKDDWFCADGMRKDRDPNG